jgi:hypothetical protein
MDLPIQRVPPMVGPRPAAKIPRLGDRERNGRGQPDESLDKESQGHETPQDEEQEIDGAAGDDGEAVDAQGAGEEGADAARTDETPPRIDLMA